MYLETQRISSILITNQIILTKTYTFGMLSFQMKEPLVHIIFQEGFLDEDLIKIQWALEPILN